ncbi:MAG: sodium:proton antiporter [Kiritimatiellales bacterium]|nr:sodium:proton antiporter [Kiritimatiellales bacterium]
MESGLVNGLVFVCLFLIGLCAIEHHFKSSRLPYICWVVLFGVGYGLLQHTLLPILPAMQLEPDVILYIFLPVLIFDASRSLDFGMARAEAVPASLLASLGILASMLVMAVPLHWATDLPWIDILFFTAIMSATDPVAVGAVFQQFPIPGKLRTLIESESLLNDGTTIILFTLLGGKVLKGKAPIFEEGILSFMVSIAAAVLLGAATGWFVAWLMRRWQALKDHFVGSLLPLLIVYLTFCMAQAWLQISGVIAVMATTIVFRMALRRYRINEMPTQSEMAFYQDLWEFFGDLANAVLFFMLGVEIGSHYGEIPWLVFPVVIAALLVSRSVVVYGFSAAFRLLRIRIPMPWQHVLNLGGLKGALSVALILMIPKDYAYRHLFLCAALAMSLFTLIGNTLGMRAYLKKADLGDPSINASRGLR